MATEIVPKILLEAKEAVGHAQAPLAISGLPPFDRLLTINGRKAQQSNSPVNDDDLFLVVNI
jgi:hypothetical protein